MTRQALVVVLLALFTAGTVTALAHASLRLGVIRLGYATSEEARDRQQLEEENRKLLLEKSLLRSPERIERLARERLGMARPESSRIRVVHAGAPVVAAVSATAAGLR